MNKIMELLNKNPEALLGNLVDDIQKIVDSIRSESTDHVHFKANGENYLGYENIELAIAIAVLQGAQLFGDEEIGEYLESRSSFSVARIEHKGKLYYDFFCLGRNTDFTSVLLFNTWYQRDWNYVCFDGMWSTREEFQKHSFR